MYNISFSVVTLQALPTDDVFSTCRSDLSLNLWQDNRWENMTLSLLMHNHYHSNLTHKGSVLQISALNRYKLWHCCFQLVIFHHVYWKVCCQCKQFLYITATINALYLCSEMIHEGVNMLINLPLAMTSICNLSIIIENLMPFVVL